MHAVAERHLPDLTRRGGHELDVAGVRIVRRHSVRGFERHAAGWRHRRTVLAFDPALCGFVQRL